MQSLKEKTSTLDIEQLNDDIKQFTQVHPITSDMKTTHKGVSRLVMLDRYAFKDTEKKTLKAGDFVVLTIKEDPKFPARGTGFITEINKANNQATVQVESEFLHVLEKEEERESGKIVRPLSTIDKPLEVYYEQIALRNATGLSEVETILKKDKFGLKNSIMNFQI